MSRCEVCDASVNQRTKLDDQWRCEPCAEQFVENRKQKVLAQIFARGKPEELLMIADVRARDFDKPKGNLLHGLVSFTEKGIVFVEVTRLPGNHTGWMAFFTAIFGAHLWKRRAISSIASRSPALAGSTCAQA